MKTLLRVAATVLSVLSTVALVPAGGVPAVTEDLPATIEACERSSWEAFQARDRARYEALCCEQFYEITGEGTLITLREVLEDMPNYITKQFTMSDAVVTAVAGNVCLIRYKIRVDYNYRGEDLPTQEWFASAVWVKRGDRWLAATYQESPLPKQT